jgi:spermidine synthase
MSKVEIIEVKGCQTLWIDNELWMWDLPSEVAIQKDIASQAYGNVLVVGYGLGIVQDHLWKNPKVNDYVTLEKCREVVDVFRDTFGFVCGKIIYRDFYTYIIGGHWDCIIGDTCQEIHPLFLPEYKKFKEHAETLLKPGGTILAWGKEYFEWLLMQ